MSTNTPPSKDGLQPPWKRKALERKAHQQSQIPTAWRLKSIPSATEAKSTHSIIQECGILNAQELEITSPSQTTARSILDKIHSREWSADQVTIAFCKRAAILQQLTGCLTEIMFDAAIARARQLDLHLATHGRVVGPLHGLPLSLKDNHDVEGVDSSVGWVGLVGRPAPRDVPAVEEYRALGAVLYVKTNVPQSLMMSDSYNHVFGQSVNSLNRELISGGSSGGEGALVAGGGSVVGVGTDIGGSVRIPAVLQGLYGLSPTVGRIGNRESVRAQKYMCLPVAGPLTRNVDDMQLFLKSYWDGKPWNRDPGIWEIPWRQAQLDGVRRKSRLKIGFVVDDGVVRPQPPVARAVRDIVQRFKEAGHEVVQWDASSHREGYELWLKAVLADGGERCKKLCEILDEPLIPGMLVGKPENLLDNAQRQELADQIWDFQREYMKKWDESGLDALIMPVTQWVGMRPKVWVKSDMYVGYTAIWNLLNWTALAVPATRVTRELDEPDDEWNKYKGQSFSDQFNHDAYDVNLVDGMPVGVQIITGRFGEERAIGIAKVLDSFPSLRQSR